MFCVCFVSHHQLLSVRYTEKWDSSLYVLTENILSSSQYADVVRYAFQIMRILCRRVCISESQMQEEKK